MSKQPGSALADVAAVLGTFLLAGVACAVAWWLLTDLPEFTKVGGGGGSMGELQLAERFNADGWFAVLGAVGGFVCGAGLTWWRSRDPLLTVLLVLVGSAIAAWTTANLGGLFGPGDPDVALDAAAPGQTVPAELTVSATAAYLVWPIAALLGTLMVLWSPPRDTRTSSRPGGVGRSDSIARTEGTGPVDLPEQAFRPRDDPAASRAPG